MSQRRGKRRPLSYKREPQRLGVGGADMHLYSAPAQVPSHLPELGRDELAPRPALGRALVSEVSVIRPDHVRGRERPELGAQDVPRHSGLSGVPAAARKQRAGEQWPRRPALSARTR